MTEIALDFQKILEESITGMGALENDFVHNKDPSIPIEIFIFKIF